MNIHKQKSQSQKLSHENKGGKGKKVPVYNMNVKKVCPKSVSKKWAPKRQHPCEFIYLFIYLFISNIYTGYSPFTKRWSSMGP